MNNEPVVPLLLNVSQAARALTICNRTLAELTKNGSVPSVRIGKCVRYRPEDLMEWVKRQAEATATRKQNND